MFLDIVKASINLLVKIDNVSARTKVDGNTPALHPQIDGGTVSRNDRSNSRSRPFVAAEERILSSHVHVRYNPGHRPGLIFWTRRDLNGDNTIRRIAQHDMWIPEEGSDTLLGCGPVLIGIGIKHSMAFGAMLNCHCLLECRCDGSN